MKRKKKKPNIFSLVILLFSATLFLISCTKKQPTEAPDPEINPLSYKEIPIEYESFRKVIGWMSDEEVLLHTGEINNDSLSIFNIFTGEINPVYEAEGIILTSVISEDQQQVLLQVVGEDGGELRIVDLNGTVIQKLPLVTKGIVNVNWNPANQNQVFISYYQSEPEMVVGNWNVETNEVVPVPSTSLTPAWYSSNLYLYVDNKDDFSLETGDLYMGDTRTNESLRLKSQVSSFFVHDDTFITYTPSDFSDDELLLNYQYPFMVDQSFMEIPKVTMNERLVFPYLSQATRNTPVYGVFAKKAVKLELETGDFEFGQLDFDEKAVKPILDLPDNAPIAVSKNGKYSLYGWRFESIIDIEAQKIYSLISMPH
ncbi:hypothetical protein LHA31_00260 [Carnobacterium viridans]|uniref:YqgU-like 6-bladed beta-propeller domain-containing protein n=1 Tax=Carnobacterium viridans TaxID=174587 RepID=A0A1H0Y8P7_9LACT|nr:hypothetical protein [Carnobacterium viridans]UDE95285.1 hypothetical protein LHA31_00260 [Carnobacterium viridans]SDQ11473.1 hypothetical protein SAMN04487752_0775 [Carnobacterium viridans]